MNVTMLNPGVKTLLLLEHMFHHVMHDILTIVWGIGFYCPQFDDIRGIVAPSHLLVCHKDEREIVA